MILDGVFHSTSIVIEIAKLKHTVFFSSSFDKNGTLKSSAIQLNVSHLAHSTLRASEISNISSLRVTNNSGLISWSIVYNDGTSEFIMVDYLKKVSLPGEANLDYHFSAEESILLIINGVKKLHLDLFPYFQNLTKTLKEESYKEKF